MALIEARCGAEPDRGGPRHGGGPAQATVSGTAQGHHLEVSSPQIKVSPVLQKVSLALQKVSPPT